MGPRPTFHVLGLAPYDILDVTWTKENMARIGHSGLADQLEC